MNKYTILFSIIIFVLCLGFQSNKEPVLTNNKAILEASKRTYLEGLLETNIAIQNLEKLAIDYYNEAATADDLQSSIVETRIAFKKIEFLLDYFDPFLVVKSINGAPLPKLEPKVPEINVVQPSGLQTLDELIFDDNVHEHAEDILKLVQKLSKDFDQILLYQKNQKIQHRYVLESIRYGIIRVFTLGLTGFDTPGSVNGIEEGRIAYEAMHNLLLHYSNNLHGEAVNIHGQISALFGEAILYLGTHSDFESFDRLHFLTTYTNPLYREVYRFHKVLNIEFREEVDPTLAAHNYHSTNLFDDNFLNPAFYTEVANSDLSDPNIIDLGRLLFFDPVLSKNLDMSCASCHHPEKAFTDGLSKSLSNRDKVFTHRNAPSLVNVAYSTRYFWDMREYDLERQVKHVMHDSLEFNMDFIDLTERLLQSSTYTNLFQEAYKDRDRYKISTWSISNALAAYVNSLSSFNSPFDQYVKGSQANILEEVRNGFNLFMGKAACGTCHFAPVFNGTVPPFYQDSESEVLGVLVKYDTINPELDSDIGRLGNGLPSEEAPHYLRSFKTVTTRNAALTAPYMHNGSIHSLEELVDFYNRGGGAGMGLVVPHQTLPEDALGLTKKEASDLVAFMESLTDIEGLTTVPTQLPEFENQPNWNNRLIDY